MTGVAEPAADLAMARLARQLGQTAERQRLIERLRTVLAPLITGGLVAVQGDVELVELLAGKVAEAEALIGRIAERDVEPSVGLDAIARLLDDPLWQLADELETDLPGRQNLQRQAVLDYAEQVSEWRRRLAEVRPPADEATQLGAPCIDELEELAVLNDLVQQASRALDEGAYADAVLPLQQLGEGPLLTGTERRARRPQALVESLTRKRDRGRELMRHVELLLLRTQTTERRSSYMVLLRNPLMSGAQGITLQGASNLGDGDRTRLRNLISSVTDKVNEGNVRRIRPIGPDGAPLVPPEPLDPELADVGDLLYRLVVPDSIQRLIVGSVASLTIATNDLELPWELMAADGVHLGLQRPVARMPLGGAVPRRSSPRPEGSTLRFLLVCSNPHGDLPKAEDEVCAIAEALRQRDDAVEVVTLINAEATGAALNDALRGGDYDVVHYAGHATFHPSNPDLSGLLLHKEEIFYAEKIQRLVEGQPLVFLNACQTGLTANEGAQQTSYLGERAAGLATSFLYGGALGCIGSLWPVYDDAARHFAITFYHQLVNGNLVGEAVRLAREATHRDFPGQVTWAAYALNGDPTYRITTPTASRRSLAGGG